MESMESRSMDITAIDDPKELEMLVGWQPIEGSRRYRSPFCDQFRIRKTTRRRRRRPCRGVQRGGLLPAPSSGTRRPRRTRAGGASPPAGSAASKGARWVGAPARSPPATGCGATVDHHSFESFAARGVEETMRLNRHFFGYLTEVSHPGARDVEVLVEISRSVDGRASRTMENRRVEHRLSGLVPTAETGATCPPPAADSVAMEGDAESESPQQQHPLADVLASSLDSCTLASDAADPGDGSLALDLAFMSV